MTRPTLPDQQPLRSENRPAGQTDVVPADDPQAASPAESEIESLVRRMQTGDREAAAAFITRYGSRVRRRVRGKLGPAMRRLFDSEEILSTVGRRLDLYVRNGGLEAEGVSQLWQLIFRIADCAVLQKAHVFQRLQEVESGDSDFAQHLLQRLKQAETQDNVGAEKVIEQSLNVLPNEVDRQVLSLWLAGESHDFIAAELGVTSAAIRKRWQHIKERLRHHLDEEGPA